MAAAARHIGLNLLFLEPEATGGMEVYARQLVAALAAARPEARLTGFASRELTGGDALADQVRLIGLPTTARSRVRRIAAEQTLLPGQAARERVEVLHSLASTGPLVTPGVRRVLTIHDLIFRTQPQAHAGLLAAGLRILVPPAARRAHRIVTVSETTRRDVVEHLGVPAARVVAVPNGPGAAPVAPPTAARELRARLGLGAAPVVLTVAALRPHKNLARLVEAFARLRPPEPVLVVAGYPTPHERELRDLAVRLGVADRVVFCGWVRDEDLEGLYAEAVLLAFPSLAEGFGLPVLEAMRRGVPVACSRATALAEVGGDAALLFDPESVEAIADALARLLGDAGLRAELVARGHRRAAEYSWASTAQATWDAYDRALSEPARSSPSAFRRAARRPGPESS